MGSAMNLWVAIKTTAISNKTWVENMGRLQ